VHVQYLLALRELKHEVLLLDVLAPSGRQELDKRRIAVFLARLKQIGFRGSCAVVIQDSDGLTNLTDTTVFGMSAALLQRSIREADLLFNFHCSITQPLLNEFRRKALLDLDPGWLQVTAPKEMGIDQHDIFFTVGTKTHQADCKTPTLGKTWHTFLPPVHIPAWKLTSDPGEAAPITSLTHWRWASNVPWQGQVINNSKRDAYLRLLDLPKKCRARFSLAANIHPRDDTGDRELLLANGWELVNPHLVARTVDQYQRFIRNSRAELGCAKLAFTALRTGWFSDRSAAYLASGRPVIAEDTGFSECLPTGVGLLSFSNLERAKEAVEAVLINYQPHHRAARDIAEAYFDSDRVLTGIIETCFQK